MRDSALGGGVRGRVEDIGGQIVEGETLTVWNGSDLIINTDVEAFDVFFLYVWDANDKLSDPLLALDLTYVEENEVIEGTVIEEPEEGDEPG